MNDDMRGHNQPPEPTPLERGEALVAACNRWLAEVPQIADAEQAGRAQALIGQLRLETAAVETEWKKEREPHDLAIVRLRTKYRPPLELLGVALDKMKWLAGGWLDREKARIAKEAAERERLAAEAEVAARVARETAARPGASVEDEAAARRAQNEASSALSAAAKPIERAQIKGEFSQRAMSLRTTWRAVITDEQKALKHFAKHPAIREAALAAIVSVCLKQVAKLKDEAKAPPGVRFEKVEKAA